MLGSDKMIKLKVTDFLSVEQKIVWDSLNFKIYRFKDFVFFFQNLKECAWKARALESVLRKAFFRIRPSSNSNLEIW